MTKLSCNLNKVATVRNTRAIGIPSILHAAELCLAAGAHGITVHPRPDERHIRYSDVDDLVVFLKDWPQAEFNIEGNPFTGALDIVRKARPTQFTLVPDDPGASTSDHGWDIAANAARLGPVIQEVISLGVRASLFVDAGCPDLRLLRELGAERVELYTEPYARAFDRKDFNGTLAQFATTARESQSAGLGVNAGHDLNTANVPAFLAAVPNVLEVSIGHALVSDALEFGLPVAVRRYLEVLRET